MISDAPQVDDPPRRPFDPAIWDGARERRTYAFLSPSLDGRQPSSSVARKTPIGSENYRS